MQQVGNNALVTTPITYFTTYQQFIANQSPTYDAEQQTNLTSKNLTQNDNLILLVDKTVLEPQALSNGCNVEVKDKCVEKTNHISRNESKTNDKCIEKTVETNGISSSKITFPKNDDVNENETECMPQPCKTTDDISSADNSMVLDDEVITAYECNICTFETIYESAFKDHMRTHKKKTTFHKCPKCPFKVKCKAKVKKHAVINNGRSDKMAYCGLYEYSVECKDVLDLHLIVHRHT